jgi:UDP-2,3-diacylglucosamine hydrolase
MIGLIFGDTKFPIKILDKIKKKKIDYIIIDLSKKNIFKKNKFSYKVSIGQFGKIVKILKKNKCNKILFAGKVNKPNFSKIKLDLKGLYYIPRIIKSAKIGDAAILKEIIKIFKNEKIKTIDSLYFTPELALKSGIYSKTKPNNEDNKNIAKGITALKKINNYNFSQAAVIRNKKVIAIEGKEGTQKMLKKIIYKNIKNKGVLIKIPKKKQDLRVDLPTIGIKTLVQCKKAGLKGIFLKNKKNVFLEKKRCIDFANKNNMFIKVK